MTLAQSASLTPEQLRVAVAERLGKCTHGPELWTHEGTEGDMELVCTVCKRSLADLRYPDYPNDLNACHAFEKTLDEYQAETYYQALCEIGQTMEVEPIAEYTIHATETQRCRAFLAVTENHVN